MAIIHMCQRSFRFVSYMWWFWMRYLPRHLHSKNLITNYSDYLPGIYWEHGAGAKGHGGILCFYCFKAWGGYFLCSLQPWVGYIFPLPWSQWQDVYKIKNAVAATFFTEIAESDWNAVAPIEVNWKKTMLTPRAGSTANSMSRNIFRRQYLWKEYDLPQYQIFCLIVWGKNDRMSWG